MTTANPVGDLEPTTDTPEISHPPKSKPDSSPQPKQQATDSHARTVLPQEPDAFESSKPELDTTVGNEDMITELKINGLLGVFYPRDHSTRYPTAVYMQCDAYWLAICNVLKHALTTLAHIETDDIKTLALSNAQTLADGVVINTYLKLRIINSLNPDYSRRPKAPPSFEVPSPYALAIYQLGQIRASGLIRQVVYTPAMSRDDASRFGLPRTRKWSFVNYGRAVKYATKLGMQFSYPDHSVKRGSAWWLLRPTENHGRFVLECPLPEENFTNNMAILATLFCHNDDDKPYNLIFNLEPLGAQSFGTLLRDPPDLMSVSTFFAIKGDPS